MRRYTVGRALVAATETSLFTVPNGMDINVTFIHMSNNGTVNAEGSVYYVDSSASSTVHFFNGAIFPKGETKSFNEIALVLKEGDTLKALGGSANMSIIVTFEMYPKIGTLSNGFGT